MTTVQPRSGSRIRLQHSNRHHTRNSTTFQQVNFRHNSEHSPLAQTSVSPHSCQVFNYVDGTFATTPPSTAPHAHQTHRTSPHACQNLRTSPQKPRLQLSKPRKTPHVVTSSKPSQEGERETPFQSGYSRRCSHNTSSKQTWHKNTTA